MASGAQPLPPQGYKVDPKPPAGYVLNPHPIPFSQAVNNAANQPLSPDLEDLRNPSILDKLSQKANQVWDEIKREAHPAQTTTAPAPVSAPDTSFYNPKRDASHRR